MEFFETVQNRRSIRKFTSQVFPDEKVRQALESAILAPNSSNVQTWDFHWIKNSELKKKVVHACMNQGAAATASQLIVVTAHAKNWRRSQPAIIKFSTESNAPATVHTYYKKLVPFFYRSGFLNSLAPFKWLLSVGIGLKRPMMRGPHSARDSAEVAVKSAALASQNLMLAVTALGGASCPMEGFDDWRLRRALKLSSGTRIVMVIGIGFPDPKGTWGPRFRLPLESVLKIYE